MRAATEEWIVDPRRVAIPLHPRSIAALAVTSILGLAMFAWPLLLRTPPNASMHTLDAPFLFRRDGNPYTGPDGHDWSDNHRRYGLLGWAAAHLAGLGKAQRRANLAKQERRSIPAAAVAVHIRIALLPG